MPNTDGRVRQWNLSLSSGTTTRIRFTSPDPLDDLSVYVGGTVTDVDLLTGATQYVGVLSGSDLIADVDVVAGTGGPTPLRLVVNGAVVTVGVLTRSTRGAASSDVDLTLTSEGVAVTLEILGSIQSAGGGGGGGGTVESVVAGDGVDVDATDPANPVVSMEALTEADIPAAIARDAEVTAAIAALSTVYQPLDSDLTAIAALTTTAFGRSLLTGANAAAARTLLELGTAATAATGDFDAAGAAAAAQAASQPLDSDLTAIAALATTAFGRGLLILADASALRSAAGLILGTDIYSKAAVDGLISALSGTYVAQDQNLADLDDAGVARANLGLIIGTDVQEHDDTLDALAGLGAVADRLPYFTGVDTAALATFSAFARTLVDDPDATTARATLVLGNVDNTSDANKPVSTATQTALNAKVDTATLAASGVGFVNHGSTAATARPSGYASVIWLGTVEPDNWTADDFWEDPS